MRDTQLRALAGLEPGKTPPASLFACDLADPSSVERQIHRLYLHQRGIGARIAVADGRLRALKPVLLGPIDTLAKLRKQRRRNRRPNIPMQLTESAAHSERQLTRMRLHLRWLSIERSLTDQKMAYLVLSQPARLEAVNLTEDLARHVVVAKRAAEDDRDRALEERIKADHARQAALATQRRARSEAERLLAAERARLEGVRGGQARIKQRLAQEQSRMIKLQVRLETFRGSILSRADALKKKGKSAAASFDRLYDEVVRELVKLRPIAVQELEQVIGGRDEPAGPGERLTKRLYGLDKVYGAEVGALEKLRLRLARAAARLGTRQTKLSQARLELLHREITSLNDHRIALLAWISSDKRAVLTGLTREMVTQLHREVTQLIFDGLYWVFNRLRQIDQVPRLIIDFFTVGSVLWKLIKIILMLLLLRFMIRRWDGWLQAAVAWAGASLSLGRYAMPVAKLLDALRHCGPALLVLIIASIVYQVLGGEDAATEFSMIYVVFFWTAAYRLQLRLVESLAKYTGMAEALRMVEEGEELFEEEREGPPTRLEMERMALEADGEAAVEQVIPASVLLVRSVRAATRYILAVVLILELTTLAVGKGTIYGLTAEFSWWATLPFIIYFLHLWRPHTERVYQQRFTDVEHESFLARMVRRTHGRVYGIFVIGAAVVVLLGSRMARFARRYLGSLDATKKLLAFIFRRQVEKHAQQMGRVVVKRQDLPEKILEQFSSGAGSGKYLPTQEHLFEEFKEAYRDWKEDGRDGSTALIASEGMGKTLVIRGLGGALGMSVLRGELKTKIIRPAKVVSWLAEVFGISPRPNSVEELIKEISACKREVVAIDNCHNLFLRQVGGFDGWEAFIRIINETTNTFWILSFNLGAWKYLNNVAGRARFFRRVVQIPDWSVGEIRKMIMSRMRRARYGVSFSDLVVTSVEGATISAQVGRTSHGYFRLLWDYTGGNPRLARYFWLNSLVPEEEGRMVKVHLFSMPSLDQLEELPLDILFVLAAVVQHENLTAVEAAHTTNLPRNYCNFAFRYCQENGFLEQDPQSGRARLSMQWQQPIIRFMKRKHLVKG